MEKIMMRTKNNSSNRGKIVLAFVAGFILAMAVFVFWNYEWFNPPTPFSSEEICAKNQTPCLNPSKIFYNATIASPIGLTKADFLQKMVQDPLIQEVVKESNYQDSQMEPDIRTQIFVQREKTWTTATKPTPFMESITNNTISKFLKDNHVIPSDKFDYLVFGEHIISNIYGANVATSTITDNYLQSNDDWWQQAKNNPQSLPFARECEFDSSAQMYSEDLVTGIFDKNGQLIGIMNSATPCDVTQQSLDEDKSIKIIPKEDLSEIGKFKLSFLQKLTQDPAIQALLESSNQKFVNYSDEQILDLKNQQPWPAPDKDPTDLQISIINNGAADVLRSNMEINSTEHGLIGFPEMILTNSKGITVASTNRTYDYIQYFEEWWIVASENGFLVRECGFDNSIQMTSEDIIIQIFNKKGEFVGILNAASPCNVIEKKGAYFGDSN